MTTNRRSTRPIRKLAVQMAVLSVLLGGAIGLTAGGPAVAAGQSNTVFNCYTQWWNTAWAQRCPNGAAVSGVFYSGVACSAQSDKSLRRIRFQGSTVEAKGDDCRHSASRGWITYNTN